MANVTVTTSNPSITVDSTNSIITVSQTTSNVAVGEVSPATVPANLITSIGTFGTLNVGNATTTQYTFPIDAPTVDAGLKAYANGTLYWSTDVGLVDSVNGYTGNVTLTTTDIGEGTNLYYTNARVLAYIQDNGLDFNAEKVDDRVANLMVAGANLSYTYDDANGTLTLSQSLTTDDITEGSNQYYTDARVDSRLSSGSVATITTTGNITSGSHFVGDNLFASSNTLTIGTSTGTSETDTIKIKPGVSYGNRLVVGNDHNSPYLNFTGGHNGESLQVGGRLSVDTSMDLGGRYLYVGADQHSDFSTWNSDTTPGNVRINFGLGAIGTNAAAQYGSIVASRRDRYGTTDYSMKMGWVDNNEIGYDSGAFIPFSDLADTKVATTFTSNLTVEGTIEANSNLSTTQHLITNNISPLTGTTINVNGDLEVAGNINYINVEDVQVEDNKIIMNFGNASARDAFITVDRSGSGSANAQLKWNETTDRWQISNDGSTYYDIFVNGDALTSSNITVSDTLKVDTIDNNTGSNITMNANVIIGVNPTGTVTSNVYASTAITSIISALNSGQSADLITLSGHGSQVFSDGTYIEIEGIIDSGATEINDNSPYYTKWNNIENGYELYEDSGLLTPAHPATTSSYIGSPAGSPVAKNVTGTTTTTTFGPANLYLSGNIDSGNITNSGIITTTNSKTTTLSQTAEARPINLTDKYKITGDNLQLTQTGLVGSAPNSQGGSIGDGVFKYGEIQWEGLEPISASDNISHSSNVIPEAYNIVYNATAGSATITLTGINDFKTFNNQGTTTIDTSNLSSFITNNIRTGMVVSQNLNTLGAEGTVGFNEKPLYVVSTDAANSTITFNDVADANITGDTTNGITNGGYLTLSEGVYNGSTGLRVPVLDGTYIGAANTALGHFTPVSFNRKNHNVEFDLDDLSYSAGIQRQDFSMGSDTALFRGRHYWKLGKSTQTSDTYQDESTFRAPRGIVVGNNTEIGNRPFRDTFEVNGINIGWDGKSESLGQIHSGKNLPVTQIGMGAFTDFSAQDEFGNYKSLAGPRLMFSSFDGNTDTPQALQFPKAGTEMGRVMAWGRSQTLLAPSTYNPSAKLSFYAVDYTGSNKTTDFVLSKATQSTVRQHIATDSNYQTTSSDSNSLHLSGGKIYFSPIGENNTSAQNRAPLETYAVARTVEATNTGSALYAYTGHNASKNNDVELGLFRNANNFANVTIRVDRGLHYSRGSTDKTFLAQNFYSQGTFGVGGDAVRTAFLSKENSSPADFVNGDQVTLNGFSGSFGSAVNGNTYYAKLDFGLLFTLFTDSALTTGLNTGVANATNIDEDGTATITFINRGAKYTGGAHRLYSWFLPSDQDDLYMYKDGQTGTTLYRYDSANSVFKYGSIGLEADTFTGNLTGNVTGTVSDLSNQQNYIRALVGAGTGISYDSSTGIISLSDTDLISGVTAGSGLTGGGDTGNVTLNIGAGNGITVNADNVAVDMSVFSTTDLSEGTNLYYTDARADARVNLQTGTNLDLSNKDTDDLSEGSTNLYYTDARANSAIDAKLESFSANVTTTGDISGATITATDQFIGDVDGAVLQQAYNNTAGTLNKGQVVYITNAYTGDNPHIELADADDSSKMPAMGIVYENISASNVGKVVISGELTGIDTTGYSTGDDLYVDTTAGGLVNTPPTGESAGIQKVAKVVKGGISGGAIIVTGAYRTNAVSNLNDGNIFIGNSSNQAVTSVLDTSIVPENTNLYYTDARVDARLNSGSVASISADDITLKQFQETVVNHGNQSGDISSTLDLANGSIFKLTATGALTINSIANVAAGSSGVIIITQDGTGSRALTTGANIKWAGGLNTLSTTPADIDIINFFYDGSVYYFALSKGYA